MLADVLKLIVSQRWGAAGNPIEARGSKDGCLMTQDGHARFQDIVLNGNAYTLGTPAAGVLSSATTASTTAATATPFVGIINPAGSGVNCVILEATYGVQSTGVAAVNEGIPVYQYAGGATNASTSIAGTVPLNLKSMTQGGSKCIGSLGAAYTGNAATWVLLKPFGGLGGARVVAPTASINVNTIAKEFVDGLIIIPPGFGFGIFNLAAGTTITCAASLSWEEVPIT